MVELALVELVPDQLVQYQSPDVVDLAVVDMMLTELLLKVVSVYPKLGAHAFTVRSMNAGYWLYSIDFGSFVLICRLDPLITYLMSIRTVSGNIVPVVTGKACHFTTCQNSVVNGVAFQLTRGSYV